ncbi:MAG TPA: phosphate acyltransferase PlsX [Armatimonadota bacterium]|jgi:glycerol-3-phosphate acyltransferase PlsX|nr:phosphate acyltransferase PlsX [Armatimonadota bacterium]
MRIAVDAMGGDYAPAEIVKGAVGAAALYDVDIVLVGDEQAIKSHLPKRMDMNGRVEVHHTPDCIRMDDHVDSIRTKPGASVVIAAGMVRSREAQAMISVGNTAAAMAVATLKLGRIPGIDRPAIATILPSKGGNTILLDAGATADCSVNNLLQFAIMGSIYAEKVLKKPQPRVGLLSIGEESSKGNELTKATHPVLREMDINFIGNVEGRDLFSGGADVVVADGFVGNVALKVAEGLADLLLGQFREMSKNPILKISLLCLKPALMQVKRRFDYTQYGGAPLLGVNGVCIIGHGRSNAKAVSSAIRAAKEAVDHDIINCIKTSLPSVERSPAVRS